MNRGYIVHQEEIIISHEKEEKKKEGEEKELGSSMQPPPMLYIALSLSFLTLVPSVFLVITLKAAIFKDTLNFPRSPNVGF